MRLMMQLLYRVRKAVFRVFRVKTRGAKVMVLNPAGELLLIRNSYGPTHLWVLPGGGIHRRETPEAAGAREVKEEVGLQVTHLTRVSEHFNNAEGKRDTIFLFTAKAKGEPVIDTLELEEARFFPLNRLPESVSTATLRRIAEYRGERTPDGRW
ncbi:MAG TPA: NUDIX domain-containing protein [Allosphingosinicella sp.]|jgi:ADP-ribose pyrophosphatase YjhB (NUDIX family)